MKELLEQLIEDAKKDRAKFTALKSAIVKCQQFELAGKLREIEKEIFPQDEETKKAHETSKQVNLVFRMVEIKTSNDIAWLLYETMKLYAVKKGEFDIRDASELMAKKKKLFIEGEDDFM